MAKPNPIELQKALKGVDYPCDQQKLVEAADRNHAKDELKQRISSLPKKKFENPAEVQKAVFRSEK
jgi:Protein of unknown function (DUF2795)